MNPAQSQAFSQRILTKAHLFLVAVVFVAVLVGGQTVFTAATNTELKTYPLEKYSRERPGSKWIKLTGGYLDLPDASYSSEWGVIKEITAPLRIPADRDEKVVVLVASDDPAVIDLLTQFSKQKTSEERAAFVTKHRAELYPQRDIRGLIRFGTALDSRDAFKLSELHADLVSDFVILDEGASPHFVGSVAITLGTVGLLVWLGRIFSKRKGKATVPPPLP